MQRKLFYSNEELLKTLLSAAAKGTLPHAIVLEGDKGMGKHTLARIISAAIMCKSSPKPCGNCTDCANILSGIHADVLEYADNSIDTVRNVREQAFILPNQGDSKVFIFTNAGSMTPQAQNAVLKVLEEPPERVYFILCTVSRNELLPTVLSRCVVYALQPVGESELREYLSGNFPDAGSTDVENAVKLCAGNIGVARALMSDESEGRHFGVSIKIAQALAADNEWELLKSTALLEKDKEIFPLVVRDLMSVIVKSLEIRCGYGEVTGIFEQQARELAKVYTVGKLNSILSALEEFDRYKDSNLNYKLNLTRFSYKLRQAVQ